MAYVAGKPIMGDQEYDSLKRQLKVLCKFALATCSCARQQITCISLFTLTSDMEITSDSLFLFEQLLLIIIVV